MYDKDSKFSEELLIKIFVEIDDICSLLKDYVQSHWLSDSSPFKKAKCQSCLSESEIITLLIFYHYSGYKCFEYYYKRLVKKDLQSYFPRLVSYNRFLELIETVQLPLYIINKILCGRSEQTGIYYIDSKRLVVCHNKRITQNKVFQGVATRGKSSMGWFYGFKLHLLINQKGEAINFEITAANVADNNQDLLRRIFSQTKGTCFGDKGYLSKIWQELYQKGMKLVTKVKKNMKNKLIPSQERYLLAKRAIIESVNDIFISVFDMEHSRHRKPENAITNILAACCAYYFHPDKPSINIPKGLNYNKG